MQCCACFEIVDGHEVVIDAKERTYDPQETARYVKEHFPAAGEDELPELFEANKQYAPLQANEKPLPDNACHVFKEKLANLNSGEKLLSDGTIINDCRNKEYWIKNDERWIKDKILQLGAGIPQGAIPADDLRNEEYQIQREEIFMQEEEDRIEALTPEQKEQMLQAALDNLADETARLEKRAQIQGKEFDPVAWYQEGKAKLYEKYRLSLSEV